jgi:hypothetical protein
MQKLRRHMKINYWLCFIAFALMTLLTNANAQVDTTKPLKVAIFAPLYIDDAFDGSTYTLGKANLPKNILPGLEFYNGVIMAVDSLSHEGLTMEVSVYDTKQSSRSLSQILAASDLSNTGLLIAAITNTFELKQFSQLSVTKNIPLISATYPNTVGVAGNPNFVLLNSSFSTHLEGLYKYMQRFYLSSNIIALRQPGATEDFVKSYFTTLNKGNSSALKIRWIDLKDGFTPDALARSLDSTKNNIVFVASPSEDFGLKVVKALSTKTSYRTTAIGMPTWDRMSELNSPDCKNVEIVFSTPFVYNSSNSILSSALYKKYESTYYSRPSDMVYKGFETTYRFTKLLSKHKNGFINNLSDKEFTLFNQFDIQPVKVTRNTDKADYLENKKLYFIRKQSGNLKSII